MNSPLVSVVTTVYNGAQYFDRAVPSILAQTFSDFEYVLVDDGSSDHTLDFLLSLEPRDARVRVHAPGRLGRSQALNYGVRSARGKYIAIQDFDDRSRPQRLDLQVAFLETHPKVGVVGGACLLIDEQRGERYVRSGPQVHSQLVRDIPRRIPFAHTTAMFRKQAWTMASGYPGMDDIEDLTLWIAMIRAGWELGCLPDVVGEHWVHQDSYWHRNFNYRTRQRTLREVQHMAVRQLDLPVWMHIYPFGRKFYGLLPTAGKRILRRSLGRSIEADVKNGFETQHM